jgi:hypothetical protein
MCKAVAIGDNVLESCGELSDALGVPIMLREGCTWEPEPDECLCNCDIRRMAKEAGRKCAKPTPYDPFIDWVIS